MSNKIKVLISGEMRAMFHQVVEMDAEEFDRLDAGLDDGERSVRRAAEREIENLLNVSHIVDLDDFELSEFHEIKPITAEENEKS